MATPHTSEQYFVDLGNPGLYVEQLLAGTPDAVEQARLLYLRPGFHLPDYLVPSSEYMAFRAATAHGHPYGDPASEKAAAYRGIDFGHLILSCTSVKNDVIFHTGPLVTRLKPQERYDRIILGSSKLIEKSGIIDLVIQRSLDTVDPLQEEPELAQYGMLMAFHMAGYGEMRKHQEYLGNIKGAVAQGSVTRLYNKQLVAAALQEFNEIETLETLWKLPEVPEPGHDQRTGEYW